MADKNMDFSRISEDEKINGIKITSVPKYIREKAYLTDFSETLAQLAEMIIQLGVNLSLDPDEALEWARKLQESVSQSEFDSWVATLLDGGPSIFMNTLNELKTTYPNGAPGVALVRETDPAKIYVWNGSAWEDFGDYQGIELKDNTVTPGKTTFVTILSGENTYDESTNTLDTGLSMTTGLPFSTPTYDTTDYIPAKPNTTYIFSDICRVAEYADKTAFVKGTVDVQTITTSSSTRYIRIMVLKTSVNFRFNEGTVLLPPGSTDPLLEIKNLELPKINVDKIEGLTGQGNVYDDTKSLLGYAQVSDTISANASYKLSDFIDVDENDDITVSYARHVFASFFDKDKAYITSLSVSDVTGTTKSEQFNLSFNPPQGAAFARFNIYLANANNFMVIKNMEMPLNYIPKTDPYIEGVGTKFKSLNLNHFDDTTVNTLKPKGEWLGKKGVTAGDSITWYDKKPFGTAHFDNGTTAVGYQTYMRDELGVAIDNIGASGNNLTKILDIIKAYNFADVDFATITSGANDWSQEREIGSLALPQSTFNENTYCGALQSAVEFIINANSNTKIILITPIRGYHPTSTHTGEWLTKGRLVNDMLEQPEDYAQAIKDVAELYGLDYVDFRDFTGLNFLTSSLYLGDNPSSTSGKLVHPNNLYYEKMGKYIVSQFKTFSI